MNFQWLLLPAQPTVVFAPTTIAVIALFTCFVTTTAIGALSLEQARLTTSGKLPLWVGALLIAIPAAATFIFTLGTTNTAQPLALLGMLPIFVIALWLGRLPAMTVGFITGAVWMLFAVGRITLPFELALFSAVLALMLHQRYSGRLAALLRHPLFASTISVTFVLWPLSLFGILTSTPTGLIAGIERTINDAGVLLLTYLAMSSLAAISLTLVRLFQSEWLPTSDQPLTPAPWQMRLRQRVLAVILPLVISAIFLLVGTVTLTSYTVATQLIVGQMERDAQNVASSIPFFIQVGQGLIRDLADNEAFQSDDLAQQRADLDTGLRSVPFFEQLVLFDEDLSVIETSGESGPITEAELERVSLALEDQIPGEVVVFTEIEESAATLTFIAPITSSDANRAILGRTTLDTNPTLAPVSSFLQTGSFETGEGFLINEDNRILLYPSQPVRHQQFFERDALRPLSVPLARGQALRQPLSDGSTALLYILPITGRSDWSIVLTVPNTVVIDLAAQIAIPTLLLMIAITALGLTISVLGVQRITEPIEQLSTAVGEITAGNLDAEITAAGPGEIGQLGVGFEEMRLRLKRRITELERLLNVTQSVSSSLELYRSVPPILGSAIEVTNALSARIILREEDGQLQRYTSGKNSADITNLDEPILDLVERQGVVVISQLQRAAGSLELEQAPEEPAALLAFPLRSERSFLGVMWVGYDEAQTFEEAEVAFLTTLAGQASASASNALLFSEAEEGRSQLETVLDSTADGMIVTDQDGHILLFNPAAEQYLGVKAAMSHGRLADEIIQQTELVRMLTNLQEPVTDLEIPGAQGEVILVNTSTIISDGTLAGRVAVLRDITALKELDSIKTVFLRMVSHDLRSPLTFMRGYISMLPIMGPLNEKQMESLAKIDSGIDYISEMTQRLTHLSRLTFGEEAELEYALVDVEELINDILTQIQSITEETQLVVELTIPPNIPLIYADYMLYRQAIYNLLNNAIKYGGDGGRIDIIVETSKGLISISIKDTGVGIREEDQPRLFDAFYRVPQREGDAPRPEGTGLGLALVRAITEAHGGQFQVDSIYGEGSTFSITFPIRGASAVDQKQ